MSGVDIQVTYGTGSGETNVAAFYAALKDANIHPLNFLEEVPLIPAGSNVRLLERDERAELAERGKWGDLAYLTLARSFGNDRGREYFAGLGWYQDPDGSGFFLRYPGIDPVDLYSETAVEKLIERGVDSILKVDGRLKADGKGKVPGLLGEKIVSIKCEEEPVSAVVCALFKVLPL